MDLLSVFLGSQRGFPSAVSWFLSSDIRASVGLVSARRLLLMGLFNTTLSKDRLSFMVTDEQEALAGLARTRPGLLIVAEPLARGSSLALVNGARSVVQDIRTIWIVSNQDECLVVAGLSAADAVLCENDCFEQDRAVISLIRSLAMGKRYRSPTVHAAMAAMHQPNNLWRDAPPDLTPRELEMVELMLAGLNDRQIAERLGVGYEAARSYGKNLRRKLGAKTRAQAVGRLIQLGIGRLRGKTG